MTPCDDLASTLGRGEALPSTLQQHAQVCPGCGSLVLLDQHLVHAASRSRALTPSPELRALLSAPVAPVPSFSVVRRAWGPVGVGLIVSAGILVLHPRRDLAGQPGLLFWSVALVLAAAMTVGVGAVLLRGREGLGLPATSRVVFAAVAVLLFDALALWTTHPVEGSITDPAVVGAHLHLHCALLGSVVAVGVLAVLLTVSRRTAAASPGSAGLAAGIAGGYAGVLALQCICPVAVPGHVLLGHGAVMVVGALLGTFAGRQLLAP